MYELYDPKGNARQFEHRVDYDEALRTMGPDGKKYWHTEKPKIAKSQPKPVKNEAKPVNPEPKDSKPAISKKR
jgi:hypothetical protein